MNSNEFRRTSLLFAVSFVSAYLFSADFEYYDGPTTAEWALKKISLADAKVFAKFLYEKDGKSHKYYGYLNPTDSRGLRSIVCLNEDKVLSAYNRSYTSGEQTGLLLAAGLIRQIYEEKFGIAQLTMAGNNAHKFNNETGKTIIGRADEPHMLHIHIWARSDPSLPVADGVIGGPKPGLVFDMRGQTKGEEGNHQKTPWSEKKMTETISWLKKELTKRTASGDTFGLKIATE